ncbi:unknown_gene_1628 [Phodopus roborovskii]|uniref:Prolactin-induced protein n=1 Tax=Phodopus roborovskii TaxID=109678 RepID=A0AAV0AFU7_PHORO|nr:unknown_gene_1628 [Phodopus roborovskii]
MPSHQVLYQPRAVTHLLIVYLVLKTAYGQHTWKGSPANQFLVNLTVTNNVDKCMAVKTSTEDNLNIEYLSAQATFIPCKCATQYFMWETEVSAKAVLQGDVKAVPPKDIIPEGERTCPVTTHIGFITRESHVTRKSKVSHRPCSSNYLPTARHVPFLHVSLW